MIPYYGKVLYLSKDIWSPREEIDLIKFDHDTDTEKLNNMLVTSEGINTNSNKINL